MQVQSKCTTHTVLSSSLSVGQQLRDVSRLEPVAPGTLQSVSWKLWQNVYIHAQRTMVQASSRGGITCKNQITALGCQAFVGAKHTSAVTVVVAVPCFSFKSCTPISPTNCNASGRVDIQQTQRVWAIMDVLVHSSHDNVQQHHTVQ